MFRSCLHTSSSQQIKRELTITRKRLLKQCKRAPHDKFSEHDDGILSEAPRNRQKFWAIGFLISTQTMCNKWTAESQKSARAVIKLKYFITLINSDRHEEQFSHTHKLSIWLSPSSIRASSFFSFLLHFAVLRLTVNMVKLNAGTQLKWLIEYILCVGFIIEFK